MDLCWQWFNGYLAQQQQQYHHHHQHQQQNQQQQQQNRQQQLHHQQRLHQQQEQAAVRSWEGAAMPSQADGGMPGWQARESAPFQPRERQAAEASGGRPPPAVSMDLCAVMAAACAQVSVCAGERVCR